MDLNNISFYNYKYKIEKMVISGGSLDEPYEINPALTNEFKIEKDYESNVLPYFEISVALPNSIMRAMLKGTNNNYKANLTIKCARYDSSVINTTELDRPKYTGFISDVFKIFFDDQDPILDDRRQADYEKYIGLEKNQMDSQNMSFVRFVLYKESYYVGMKTVTNAVIKGGDITTVLTYILNKAKINKVLLSPPNNTELPSEFILLPITALEQIEYLANQFAMHNAGTLIFFDLDRAYIINKVPQCTAYEINEYTKTYLISLNKGNNSTSYAKTGSSKNDVEKCNICLISKETISATDNSEYFKETVGSKFILIDSNTGEQSEIGSGDEIAGVLYTKQNSTKTFNMVEQTIKEAKKKVTLYLENTDISFLTPNKEFIISTDDPKNYINGSYRIIKCNTLFVKDGSDFSSRTVIELRGQ